ncbi:hypothetical protein FOWG_17992 [Fusarium oxysporum f. sp. lycopersici MN25]|nr:hypothetical protein FOWG_17992 [Fusarium oxysporum f. sp. lycopersici MN25]
MPRSPLPSASTSSPVVKGRALSLATEPLTNSTINGRSPVVAAQSAARSASPRPVNGRDMSIGDGEVESELSELSELASTVHSASGVDSNELEDEIIVGVRTNSARKSCPLRPASDPEDETMADADDEPVASHYPKRKRATVFHDLSESKMEPLRSLSGERQPPAAATRAKTPQTSKAGVKGVILGYWRDSPGPTEDFKHAVIGYIDIHERLRTRIQPTTIAGETISDEYPLPPGPGGSWVTFERIVFLKHLIGLDHLQVKEYVKIRADSMGTEETQAEQVAAKIAAVKEAMRHAKLNPTAENATNPPQIAYGVELPDHLQHHLQQSRDPKRRRRTSGGFSPINTVPSNGPVIEHTTIKPAPGGPQPVRNVMYPLPGTRPTRILLGHWAKSDEPDPKNRHAVYGILGQNDSFRVKLVQETRDGRFVDGNFPTGAGALWIAYEEVAFEPHLRSLARNEVKEYCRVRQWQIDCGETAEEKTANETKAVYEAQARVAGTNFKAPTPLSIAPTLPRQPDNYVEETDQTGRLGFRGHELRQSRRVEAARAEARLARQVLVKADTPQPPPVHRPATSRTPQSNNALERTMALAEREITRVELAQEHAYLQAADRELAAVAAAAATAAAAAIPDMAVNGRQQLQRLNKVWARQEIPQMKARAEDAKIYSGVKYERKVNGPFTGKLVSQGTIINIDGEDYVEYRVLTKPSFF